MIVFGVEEKNERSSHMYEEVEKRMLQRNLEQGVLGGIERCEEHRLESQCCRLLAL